MNNRFCKARLFRQVGFFVEINGFESDEGDYNRKGTVEQTGCPHEINTIPTKSGKITGLIRMTYT